jgi:hypothetical protein
VVETERVECRTSPVKGKATGNLGNRELASERRHWQERIEVRDALTSPDGLGVVVDTVLH